MNWNESTWAPIVNCWRFHRLPLSRTKVNKYWLTPEIFHLSKGCRDVFPPRLATNEIAYISINTDDFSGKLSWRDHFPLESWPLRPSNQSSYLIIGNRPRTKTRIEEIFSNNRNCLCFWKNGGKWSVRSDGQDSFPREMSGQGATWRTDVLDGPVRRLGLSRCHRPGQLRNSPTCCCLLQQFIQSQTWI